MSFNSHIAIYLFVFTRNFVVRFSYTIFILIISIVSNIFEINYEKNLLLFIQTLPIAVAFLSFGADYSFLERANAANLTTIKNIIIFISSAISITAVMFFSFLGLLIFEDPNHFLNFALCVMIFWVLSLINIESIEKFKLNLKIEYYFLFINCSKILSIFGYILLLEFIEWQYISIFFISIATVILIFRSKNFYDPKFLKKILFSTIAFILPIFLLRLDFFLVGSFHDNILDEIFFISIISSIFSIPIVWLSPRLQASLRQQTNQRERYMLMFANVKKSVIYTIATGSLALFAIFVSVIYFDNFNIEFKFILIVFIFHVFAAMFGDTSSRLIVDYGSNYSLCCSIFSIIMVIILFIISIIFDYFNDMKLYIVLHCFIVISRTFVPWVVLMMLERKQVDS